MDASHRLFPRPRSYELLRGELRPGASLSLELPSGWSQALDLDLNALSVTLQGKSQSQTQLRIRADLPSPAGAEEYQLVIRPEAIELSAADPRGARSGLRTLTQLLADEIVPCCRIDDGPVIGKRGFQIDIARSIERPETVQRLLPLYASFNYNIMQLYFEDAFLFESCPDLARPFAWTAQQTLGVVREAQLHGIDVIPAIQSLGHCPWTMRQPQYKHLDEGYEQGELLGMLCPSHPETLGLLEGMIRDVAPLASSGTIHIGMDEAFFLGRCSRCRPRVKVIGEAGLFVEHANRVAALVRAVGKQPAMWGDMFYYHAQALDQLDKDILIVDWYYYSFPRYPRIELFGFEELDTRALWRQHSLKSWGCCASVWTGAMPLNQPSQAIDNARSWVNYKPGDGIMVAQWELGPTTIDFCPPIDGAIGGLLWRGQGESGDLLSAACAKLYRRPELAPLLDEMGNLRFTGHPERAWLNATTLSQMVTHEPPEMDLDLARRADQLAERLGALAEGATHEEMILSFVAGAQWLAYQYRKRGRLNEATSLIGAGEFHVAGESILRLANEAAALAQRWQAAWDKNRYAEDHLDTALGKRLHVEAKMLQAEADALRAAISEESYKGQLLDPVLTVDIVNTHPGCPRLAVSTSADGQDFKLCGKGWIIMFDSRAAQPASADLVSYRFRTADVESARYVKIAAEAAGQFAVKGVTLHRGSQCWKPKAVRVEKQASDGEAILHGELARVGCADVKRVFERLCADGDSGRLFSMEHGSIVVEMDVSAVMEKTLATAS